MIFLLRKHAKFSHKFLNIKAILCLSLAKASLLGLNSIIKFKAIYNIVKLS